jgi:hypothetical protein
MVVSVPAALIATRFIESSAAPVMLARLVTVTVVLTKYAVPISLDLVVNPLAVVTLEVATVGDGAVASTVIDSAVDVVELPAESVSVTEILQIPSDNVAKSHVLVAIVHKTLVAPCFVAVTTAVPEKVPETLIVGVLSEVMLSVTELPESDIASRSGGEGVVIVDLLITSPVNAVEATEVTLLKV